MMPLTMTLPPLGGVQSDTAERIEAACARACSQIAPAWPLDRAIAVNPHWGRIERPLREVAARMAVFAGIRVFPPRQTVREAWHGGRVGRPDLVQALAAMGRPASDAAACIAALDTPWEIHQLPLLIDILDDDPVRHTRLSWRQAITHQVSQTCAAYFDRHQADWQPDRSEGLYGFWRDTLSHDHGIGTLMGLPALGRALGALPATRREAEAWVIERLGLPESVWADYLEAVLLTVNGWASWCAYLGWQSALEGDQDGHLRDLLAIRLAWGAVLLECKTDASARSAFAGLQAAWRHAPETLAEAERSLWVDEVWQHAMEAAYQRDLALRLAVAPHARALPPDPAPEVQAVFCIDVRSERLRRAVESVWPAIQTRGFAGFFGLPIAYTPFATDARRPQLPGLLSPALEVTECFTRDGLGEDHSRALAHNAARTRRRRLAWAEHWRSGSRWPSAAYSYVEAAGIGYLGALARWLHPSSAPRARDDLAGLPRAQHAHCRPALAGAGLADRVQLAARVLRAMELDQELAPLVLLVGHGSQSTNNAHAAALDCGACCGQSGEVNARVLADLLNDSAVRNGLAAEGIAIPAQTSFVAALHNTTTDELEWFDIDALPAPTRALLQRTREVFCHAGDQVRRERAALLGLDPRAAGGELLDRLRRRANDGAQTRPEWGLAGNAAFIIAPRARTRGTVLDGRVFLHDYDASRDPDGKRLEALMTAPMLVAHWINWQYHASTCDPERLGSGNKLLHNVIGGHIGVFEGNGGDLRIGLSRQSLHDGQSWIHEPLRLTVIIEAPQQHIECVIQQHETVGQLVRNGWLNLCRLDDCGIERYAGAFNSWEPLQAA